MKIMRALSKGVMRKLPSIATKGCQSYNDILNELVVTQALSQLHDGVNLNAKPSSVFKTIFFCLIHEIKVVNGNLERTLSKSKATSAVSDAYGASSNAESNQSEIKEHQTQKVAADENNNQQSDNKVEIKDDDLKNLSEDDRMLMESLPFEYVVSVMRHDGQPLWWMMTHKKLTSEQLASVLVQVIVGLAIAEKVYMYEHRDLHVSNILIKKTSKPMLPFVLDGNKFTIVSHGIKATIIDATFSRLTHNGKVYFRDLTSTLRAYASKKTPTKMSLQNRSYRQMVRITKNKWEEFTPKTNLIWLTYLCETLMKADVMKADTKLHSEIKKIRDYTLKVNNTIDLLGYFPFEKEKESEHDKKQPKQGKAGKSAETNHHKLDNKENISRP